MPPKNMRNVLHYIVGIDPAMGAANRIKASVTMAAAKEQYRIRYTMKAEGEDAEVMVYSEIVTDKWWDDEVSANDFDKALKEARKNGAKNLNIRINSPGGEVYAAVAMRSMVINAGFEKVRVMIEGLCASAATLFATIPGAHVVIAEGSEFMIHNPMTITWGDAAEIEKTVDHLHKMEQQFHGMYAARTGQTEDQIKEWMDATTWFTAKEACDNGFCDELLASEKIAACVTKRDMALMKAMYGDVPEQIAEKDEAGPYRAALEAAQNIAIPAVMDRENVPEDTAGANNVSNGTPVAGVPSEHKSSVKGETKKMEKEIKDISEEELRAENPALFTQVQQAAVAAERERLSDIDALTDPGYEDLAEQAKANGTSAMEFHKQLIAAKKQRGADFLAARTKETAQAAQVAGGAPADNAKTEQQEIEDNARAIAALAKEYSGTGLDGMF